MSEFNFKSSVCTSKVQSERLLALGLKKETADMVYEIAETYPYEYELRILEDGDYLCSGIISDNVPAWSLHRLVSALTNNGIIITFIDNIVIIDKHKVFQKSYEFWDDVYDNICDAIEWLIKEGYFNKEYLCEK